MEKRIGNRSKQTVTDHKEPCWTAEDGQSNLLELTDCRNTKVQKQVTGIGGVEVKIAMKGEFNYPGDRSDMLNADNALVQLVETWTPSQRQQLFNLTDAQFNSLFRRADGSLMRDDLRTYMNKTPGLTWHHAPDLESMILTYTKYHARIKNHTGGNAIAKSVLEKLVEKGVVSKTDAASSGLTKELIEHAKRLHIIPQGFLQ